jgi:hypothetical protein
MMKTFIKLLPALLFVFTASAEEYRILNLNTSTIQIGDKVCRVGDVFDSNAVIHWDPKVPLQAMKVEIGGRGQRYLHQAEFQKYNCKTLADFILQSKTLSRREMPLASEQDHIEYFEGQDFMVADTIKISSNWRIDDHNYFELSYERQDEWVNTRLTTDDQMNLLLTADLFDHPTLQKDGTIRCRVRYVEETYHESTLLTDKMRVILVPQHVSN